MLTPEKYNNIRIHFMNPLSLIKRKTIILLTFICVLYLNYQPNYIRNIDKNMKYILLWIPKTDPFISFKGFSQGNDMFIKQNCKYNNCYITSNKRMLDSIEEYDAILFDGRLSLVLELRELPPTRKPEQVYVFVTLESSYRYPVCDKIYDNFFNWTITYKLKSDIPWPYFVVKNNNNKTVGPRINMEWTESVASIGHDIKKILRQKTLTAALFLSKCNEDPSKRTVLVANLNDAFKNLTEERETIDVYGTCGKYYCPKNQSQYCKELIKGNYFFYLALENSFDEDYVTEKVLTALKYYAVPVVYGGANYSRFLPPNSYLDARKLSPNELATTMSKAVENLTYYFDFFKWTNDYTYEYDHMNFACKLCEKLNKKHKSKSYKTFRYWWNRGFVRKCKELKLQT